MKNKTRENIIILLFYKKLKFLMNLKVLEINRLHQINYEIQKW